MIIQTHPWGLRGSAPAKLNLTLDVLSKRDDGYHEIDTLMVPVSLRDTIWFRPNRTRIIDFSYSWHPSGSRAASEALPRGSQNLVVKAMEAVRSLADPAVGATVHLVKRIPTESGMGGGSSDAACALVLANLGWQADLPASTLSELAAEIGSDVPFFLANQAAICRGRGERVEPIWLTSGLPIVVVKPPVGLSTAQIYDAVKINDGRRCGQRLSQRWNAGDRRNLAASMSNDLQQAATDQSPWIERMQRDMTECGCSVHQMTGSGSAYFGICQQVRHRQIVAGRLRSRGYQHVYQMQSCRQ